MEIGFNTKCEQLKQKLLEDINNSDLPIAPVFYIYQNIFLNLEKIYIATLNKESLSAPIPEEDINTKENIKEND